MTPVPAFQNIGFLLIENFAMMSAATAIEPLRAANLLAEKQLYSLRFFSEGGGPVQSSGGAAFPTEPFAVADRRLDILFVIAGGNPLAYQNSRVFGQIRSLAVHGLPLGGISGGVVLLAKAGVLDRRRFTVHWEHFEALQALSSKFLMERRLFVIDRDRYTCAGGVAPLDMMHALIQSDHGADLANKVSDWFIHTGVRSADDPQRSGYAGSTAQLHPIVATALDLMENHIADPLSLGQVAMLAGISPRQLQRRFEQEFDKGVMQCYMEIRLQKADDLVRKTRLPFVDVAMATGFVNQAHFAKAYRSRYGATPTARRNSKSDKSLTSGP